MTSLSIHPNRLRFGLKSDQINELTDHLIKNAKETLDKIATIPQGSHTWENTVKVFEDTFADFSTESANVYFPSYIDTNKEVRDASSAGKKKLDDFRIDTYMREDLYQAILDYQKKTEKLDTLEQRLLNKTLEEFERNGLGLPPYQREKLKDIKKRISEISIKATQNMNEEATKHIFSEEELKGLPEDFLKGLSRDNNGKYILTLKYPDYVPVQKHCEIVETRKKLETAYSSRCQDENVPILEELIKLRHEGAVLLGFPNHASYILKVRMAKTPETVLEFLDDLIEKLQKSLSQDINKL